MSKWGKCSSQMSVYFLFIFSFSLLGTMVLAQDDPWLAPESSKQAENPFAKSKKSLKKAAAKGKKTFKTRCTVCHGEGGRGDGPGGKALDPKPADFASSSVQSQADGELFWKMSEGRGPMITWKLILSEEERWQLVSFLRTLRRDQP